MQHFIPPSEAARSDLADRRWTAFRYQHPENRTPAADPWPRKPVRDLADYPARSNDHRFAWSSAQDVPTDDWATMLRWLGSHPGRRILPAGSEIIFYTGYRDVTAFDRSTWRAYRLSW